jgi:hypothetical protein
MTNLTSPVASASSGLSKITMSDVIDSLKRLERLGDENSKTVQKILEAARDIEARILQLYENHADGVTISGHKLFKSGPPRPERLNKQEFEVAARTFSEEAKTLGVFPAIYDATYAVRSSNGQRCLFRVTDPWGGADEHVSATRDSALKFADDLAGGLLVVIAEDLASQTGDNERALDVLLKTKAALVAAWVKSE